MGAKFPSDVCFDDISCTIDRILSEDENSPNTGLVQWALDSGIHFSRFVNQESLIDHMLGQLRGADHWSFYSYLIYCEVSDLEESDARKLSCYNELVNCGKMIDSRPDIQKSLRENDRYNHYTKGYKAIKQWFTDHHVI